jgi:hypothetical protein
MGIMLLDGSGHRYAQLEEIRLATSAEIAATREGEWS